MANDKSTELPSLRDECKTLMTPKFYQGFQCIGPECENDCCSQWNISIDRATYHNLSRSSDIKVKQIIDNQTVPAINNLIDSTPMQQSTSFKNFVLNDKGQCPMLESDGLCYLHKNHGEPSLPMICRIYPRDDKLIDGVVYNSLSISCPEAARKILLDPSAMKIKEKTLKKSTKMPDFVIKANLKDATLQERFKQLLYQCVLGSQTDSLEQRLFKMAVVFDVVNMRIKNAGSVSDIILQLEQSLADGSIEQLYQEMPVMENVQHRVLQLLLFEQRFVRTNKVFLQYKKAAVDKLSQSDAYDEQSGKLDMAGFHHKLCDKGYQQLIETHGHAFLNLLLHWIYSRLFDLDGKSDLYAVFAQLALKFQFIRTLCGILHNDENNEDDNAALLVGVIHSLSRTSDHDQKLIADIYQKLCQDNLAEHEHILGLIKV